jgi:hypothetical protein
MIGIIGSIAANIAGHVISARSAKKQREENEKYLKRKEDNNRDWFNYDYYRDVTNRADVQRSMKLAKDAIKNRNAQLDATAAVTGLNPNAVAAERAANNATLTNVVGGALERAEDQRDNAMKAYREGKESIEDTRFEMDSKYRQQRDANVAAAVKDAIGVAGKIGDTMDLFDDAKDELEGMKNG